MVTRKVWLGSTGPFLYDDAVPYIDPDGTFYPDNQNAIATDGQIMVRDAPTINEHVVRKFDLDNAIGNISALEARVTALEQWQAYTTNTTIPDLYNKIQANSNDIVTANARIDQNYNSIVSLSSAVSVLQGKFVYSYFDMYFLGWAIATNHANTYYAISGNHAALLVPLLDATSNADFIQLGNLPADLRTCLGNMNFSAPVLAYNEPTGWDWALCSLSGAEFWHLNIYPYVKTAGFTTTGRKILQGQVIIWSLNKS